MAKRHMDPESEAAFDIVNRERIEEETRQLRIIKSHDLGLKTGRAQAFRAMRLLNEYLEFKALQAIVESKDYLEMPGVTSLEDYFDRTGMGRSTAFANLKIARTLTQDEVQLLSYIGLTRGDLLSISALSEDEREQLLSGQVIDLEKATKEDIREALGQLVSSKKNLAEELEAQKKAHARVAADHQKTVAKLEKDLARYERDAEGKGLTALEDAFLARMDLLRAGFDGYMLKADPERMEALRPEAGEPEPTPRMIAAYLSALAYMRTQVLAAYDTAVTLYGDPVTVPEEAWQPGMGGTLDAALDDLKKEVAARAASAHKEN